MRLKLSTTTTQLTTSRIRIKHSTTLHGFGMLDFRLDVLVEEQSQEERRYKWAVAGAQTEWRYSIDERKATDYVYINAMLWSNVMRRTELTIFRGQSGKRSVWPEVAAWWPCVKKGEGQEKIQTADNVSAQLSSIMRSPLDSTQSPHIMKLVEILMQ